MENIKSQQESSIKVNNSEYEKVNICKQINIGHLGETQLMNCGELAFIIEYNNNKDITVQFKETKELIKCQYIDFKKGNVDSTATK